MIENDTSLGIHMPRGELGGFDGFLVGWARYLLLPDNDEISAYIHLLGGSLEYLIKLCHMRLQELGSEMNKESTPVSSSDPNILIHVDKVQIATLSFQGQRQAW